MTFTECTPRRWALPSTVWRVLSAYTLASLVFLVHEAGAQARKPEAAPRRPGTSAPAAKRTPAATPSRQAPARTAPARKAATPAPRTASSQRPAASAVAKRPAAQAPAAKLVAARPSSPKPKPAPAPARPAARTAAVTAVAAAAVAGAQKPESAAAYQTSADPGPSARPISPGTIPLKAVSRAALRTAPDGPIVGAVEGTGTVLPMARERGWVRVRMEGWVRESDLLPVDSSLRTSLSAADLRADPEGAKGKLVRWKVEVLAFQRADALRRDLQMGEPYLLARGPVGENALLYLALPASLATEAQALPPLTVVQITARVRSGRSAPTNVPVLELETISKP